MKITFNTSAITPMINWLLDRKKTGQGDETLLREILTMPDYQVEFARYNMPNLPVCGISYEEAVDFFMNFDKKGFANQRLQYKKESFVRFYNDIENRISTINTFVSLNEEDYSLMETLLKNALPDEVLKDTPELNIILIVSIGNSMGWPYDHYIDYDFANLDTFKNKNDFLHVTAHEIHHLFIGQMLGVEGISPEGYFLQNFAYEGLAVHFMNNLATINKKKKYDDITYCMDESDMSFYEEHFDEVFSMIQRDYNLCKGKSLEEVADVVSNRYEQFTFMRKNIRQYPTYYFGCYMWGLIDLYYGKETLFETVNNPDLFTKLYNEVAEPKYRFCEEKIIIESDRLLIIKMNESMYYDVYRNSLDEDNRKYVPDEVFESLEEASGVVDFIIKSYDSEEGPFIYAVIRKIDHVNMGYVQLVKIEEGWEIGYHIAKIFTGNGYATEAVNLFLKHLKNNTELQEVYGIALASNKASRRVLEKCGFKLIYEGSGIYQGNKRKIIKTIKRL